MPENSSADRPRPARGAPGRSGGGRSSGPSRRPTGGASSGSTGKRTARGGPAKGAGGRADRSGAKRSSGARDRSTNGERRSAGRSPGRPTSKSAPPGRRSSKGTRGGGGRDAGRDAPRSGSSGRPPTAAERRAKEVNARRGPKRRRDTESEQAAADARAVDTWIDEGSVRDAASAATERARGRRPAGAPRPLDPEVAAQFVESLGKQRGDRLADRLADASEALDRERFDEARRLASSIASEAPDVAAAHQVFGLANYRLGRFKQAARALERADQLASDPALLPVLADCYRALRRWADVDRTWLRIRQISPAHEILAEGRIVAAGALADQGDLRGAIALLRSVKAPRRVREHHLREWYVLGDLYDRVGEPISARRTFEVIVAHDRDFADVTSRLRALGE